MDQDHFVVALRWPLRLDPGRTRHIPRQGIQLDFNSVIRTPSRLLSLMVDNNTSKDILKCIRTLLLSYLI